jgi:hypothetical protein
MSNHAVRPRPKKSTYLGFSRSAWAILILVFAIGLPLLVAHPWAKDDHLNWPSVAGQVLETRIGVVTLVEHQYRPSEIVYQVQAHVTYERNGAEYNTWLPFPNCLQTKHSWNSGYHKRKVRTAQSAGRLRIPHT